MTTILIATSIVPRVLGWVLGCMLPALSRGLSRAYTQEHLHELHVNPELHLGDAFAEVALVAMQARPLLNRPFISGFAHTHATSMHVQEV